MNKFQIQKPLGIITCQINPGTENQIISKLIDSDNGFCNKDLLFDAFSEFDLIGFATDINENTQKKKVDSFFCNSDYLKDIQLITCFPLLKETSSFISPLANNSNLSALTITLIRACRDLSKDQNDVGIEYELSYAKNIYGFFEKEGLLHKIPFQVYGTLGVPNLVLIQRGEDLTRLLANLQNIREYDKNESLYFHTIPCVHKKEEGNSWVQDTVLGRVYWRIGISCYDVQPSKVISEIENQSKNFLEYFYSAQTLHDIPNQKELLHEIITIDYTFGKQDIVIRPKNSSNLVLYDENKSKSPQDINFINLVLSIFSSISTSLKLNNGLETKTDLFIDYKDSSIRTNQNKTTFFPANRNPKPDLSKEFGSWYEKAKNLSDKEDKYQHPQFVYGRRVIDLIERFQLTYNMSHTWEIVFDMKDYLENVIIKLVESITKNLPEFPRIDLQKDVLIWYRSLEDDIQIVNFALDKRIAGVDLGIGNRVVSNISGLGNYKTLLAAKAISYSLFKVANSSWNGFTIFSYNPLTSCLPSGIINMPDYSLDDLLTWTQIGHETGHAYSIQYNLMETIPFLSDLSNDLLSLNQPSLNSKEICDNFIEELLADIFEYLFCYGGNFEKYRNNTWTNLDRELCNSINPDEISHHLLRTICILFIHLENKGFLENGNSVKKSISREPGLYLIYQNHSLERGILDHLLGREVSFIDCVNNNIIHPLLEKDGFVHINNEISKYNPDFLEKTYNAIDFYRSSLFSIFLNPIKNSSSSKNSIDFELGKWQKIIDKMKNKLGKNEFCKINSKNHFEVCCLLLAIQELSSKLEFDQSKRLAIILSLWDYYRQELKNLL
jgi:hypothetical protein